MGHKAYECRGDITQKCEKCGIIGHTGLRCLKMWEKFHQNKGTRYADYDRKVMRCVECGQSGHLKCTTLDQSVKLKINFSTDVPTQSFVKGKVTSKSN